QALGDLIVPGPITVRAGLSEARDGAVDQPRIDRRERLVVDTEPALDVRPEVLDHHVGLAHQALEDLDRPRVLEVERDRALVAMQVEEVEAEGRRVPFDFFARLDLDDVGAHVGELTHRRGTGAGPREVYDPNSVERQGHCAVLRDPEPYRRSGGVKTP